MEQKTQSEDKYRLDEPYCAFPPQIPRPQVNLSIPKTREEKMYCWRYWIARLLDPAHTRDVLDNLEPIPMFNSDWGNDYQKQKRAMHKKTRRKLQRKEVEKYK